LFLRIFFNSSKTIKRLKGEGRMSHILRKAVEERRKKLINKLIAFHVYKSEEQLLKLSLTELENEYKRIQSDSHPYSDTGSIHWTNKKS
jgi:Fur-regulated basic protein A